MADPLSLSTITGVVLTEGIKFLYAQAGDIIKRWNERKAKGSTSQLPEEEPLAIQSPAVLEGALSTPVIHYDRVERLQSDLVSLVAGLGNYANGFEEADTSNHELLQRVDAVRQILEAIYGQAISFRGERRAASGVPVIEGEADLDEVAGYAAAVRARTVTSGTIRGSIAAKVVKEGGEAVGVDIDRLGP